MEVFELSTPFIPGPRLTPSEAVEDRPWNRIGPERAFHGPVGREVGGWEHLASDPDKAFGKEQPGWQRALAGAANGRET